MMNYEKIKKEFELNVWNAGQRLIKKGNVEIKDIQLGYSEYSDVDECVVVAQVSVMDKREYIVRMVVSGSQIANAECYCEAYRRTSWYYEPKYCSHIAASVQAIMETIEKEKYDIFTGKSTRWLINSYIDREFTEIAEIENQDVELEPVLEIKNRNIWEVSFKIGKDKKYVIKNLTEFSNNVNQNGHHVYGKNFELHHSKDVFHKDSMQSLEYILDKAEEVRLLSIEDRYGYVLSLKRTISLTKGGIDQFVEMLGKNGISYSYTLPNKNTKEKGILTLEEKNPKLHLTITPKLNGKKEVVGILLHMDTEVLCEGRNKVYIKRDKKLYVSDEGFYQAVMPFLRIMERINFKDMQVGSSSIATFYGEILPQISKYVMVEEVQSELIQKMIPEQPTFTFYFDVNRDKEITCDIEVKLGSEQLNYWNETEVFQKGYQVLKKRIDNILGKYVSYLDKTTLVLDDEEELLFSFLSTAIPKLNEIGEVKATDQFKNLRIRKTPKLAVGVTVRNGLLDLNIETDEFDVEELKLILDSYKKKKVYHRLKDGSFLQLENSNMQVMDDLIEGLQLTSKDLLKEKIHIPAYRALYIDKVLQENEDVSYDRDNGFKEIVRSFKVVEDSNYQVPAVLKSTLRSYQKTGYRWLRMLGEYNFGGILADDMGLGKTLQVITLLFALKQEKKAKNPSLIITPASLVYNWENEFTKFAIDMTIGVLAGTKSERKQMLQDNCYDVYITSYDLLRRDIDLYDGKEMYYQIIDEAQYIKNQNTQVAKAVKIISAKHRLALTGTPIENRLSELWSIFDFLMPGFLYSYDKFKKEIETKIVKSKDEDATERLKKMVGPFIMRRLKQDVLKELPDKLEEITYSKMDSVQHKVYTAYVAKIKEDLARQSNEDFNKNKLKVLSEITRLRQICCDPHLVYDNYEGDSAKLNTCMELLQSAWEGGHKVLLFSQFTSMLAIIKERLEKEGLEYYEITGATPKAKRMQLVEAFNENQVPVFLISLKAGGTGLNLTGADMVIHYDPWWNVAAQNQATDRAHRIGQKNVVTVFKLIAKDTIEEKIVQMQESKKQLADQIISGEENQLSGMDKNDFIALFEE